MNDHYGIYPTLEPHVPGSVEDCEICAEEAAEMERNDPCPDCNDEGFVECEDADGYASARHCDCEIGQADRERIEREHAPMARRRTP